MLKNIHLKVVAIVSRRSRPTILMLCTILTIFLCWLDYITGDYSLIIFYLFPVSLAAWFISRSAGISFCLLSFIARFIADVSATPAIRYSNLHYWNILVELSFLIIMSLLLSMLKENINQKDDQSNGNA